MEIISVCQCVFVLLAAAHIVNEECSVRTLYVSRPELSGRMDVYLWIMRGHTAQQSYSLEHIFNDENIPNSLNVFPYHLRNIKRATVLIMIIMAVAINSTLISGLARAYVAIPYTILLGSVWHEPISFYSFFCFFFF